MSRGTTHVQCTSDLAAIALVECLASDGYLASADGTTVHTDAPYRVVNRAPEGLLVWTA